MPDVALDRWIYAACRLGQSGTSGYQTYTRSAGVTVDEARELMDVTRFVAAEPGREVFSSFGIKRLESGRWCLFRSEQGGQDDLGRPTYFAQAFLLDELTDLPYPPHFYFNSGSFRKLLSPQEVSSTVVPELLPTMPMDQLKPGPGPVFAEYLQEPERWLEDRLRDRHEHLQRLRRLAFSQQPMQPILVALEDPLDAVLVYAVCQNEVHPEHRAELSLCTLQTENNSTRFTVVGWPRSFGVPSDRFADRFPHIFSWSPPPAPSVTLMPPENSRQSLPLPAAKPIHGSPGQPPPLSSPLVPVSPDVTPMVNAGAEPKEFSPVVAEPKVGHPVAGGQPLTNQPNATARAGAVAGTSFLKKAEWDDDFRRPDFHIEWAEEMRDYARREPDGWWNWEDKIKPKLKDGDSGWLYILYVRAGVRSSDIASLPQDLGEGLATSCDCRPEQIYPLVDILMHLAPRDGVDLTRTFKGRVWDDLARELRGRLPPDELAKWRDLSPNRPLGSLTREDALASVEALSTESAVPASSNPAAAELSSVTSSDFELGKTPDALSFAPAVADSDPAEEKVLTMPPLDAEATTLASCPSTSSSRDESADGQSDEVDQKEGVQRSETAPPATPWQSSDALPVFARVLTWFRQRKSGAPRWIWCVIVLVCLCEALAMLVIGRAIRKKRHFPQDSAALAEHPSQTPVLITELPPVSTPIPEPNIASAAPEPSNSMAPVVTLAKTPSSSPVDEKVRENAFNALLEKIKDSHSRKTVQQLKDEIEAAKTGLPDKRIEEVNSVITLREKNIRAEWQGEKSSGKEQKKKLDSLEEAFRMRDPTKLATALRSEDSGLSLNAGINAGITNIRKVLGSLPYCEDWADCEARLANLEGDLKTWQTTTEPQAILDAMNKYASNDPSRLAAAAVRDRLRSYVAQFPDAQNSAVFTPYTNIWASLGEDKYILAAKELARLPADANNPYYQATSKAIVAMVDREAKPLIDDILRSMKEYVPANPGQCTPDKAAGVSKKLNECRNQDYVKQFPTAPLSKQVNWCAERWADLAAGRYIEALTASRNIDTGDVASPLMKETVRATIGNLQDLAKNESKLIFDLDELGKDLTVDEATLQKVKITLSKRQSNTGKPFLQNSGGGMDLDTQNAILRVQSEWQLFMDGKLTQKFLSVLDVSLSTPQAKTDNPKDRVSSEQSPFIPPTRTLQPVRRRKQ